MATLAGHSVHSSDEGDDIGILFRLMLHHLEDEGFIGMMHHTPRVASDGRKFHSQYWLQFSNFCQEFSVPWMSSSDETKYRHVHNWLFRKFSLDPAGACMLPLLPAQRLNRNEIGWTGVEMNDDQLQHLVNQVMPDYLAATE